MSEDAGLVSPLPAVQSPPPSLLQAPPEHVALSERGDPLCGGFLLAGGVLAPLPPKVRLPHEDDDDATEGEDAVRD